MNDETNAETEKREKRRDGKPRIGTLVKRGNKWLARWMINGKVYSRSTGESTRRKAEQKLAEFTAPFVLRDEKRALETIEARIKSVDTEIRIEEEQGPALGLLAAWGVYLNSQSRPRSGKGSMRNYEQQYFIFVDWLKVYHPTITELRQVNADIAAEYSRALLAGTTDEERKAKADALKKIELLEALPSETRSDTEKEELEKCKRIAALKFRPPVRGSTFNKHLNALCLIWRHCAEHETAKIKTNPWAWDKNTGRGIRRIALKHEERPRTRRTLTTEEIFKLLKTATGEMRVLVALGYYTGLRLGDAATITWGNIDRVRGIINVRSRKTDTETITAVHPSLGKIIAAEVKTNTGALLPELSALYLSGLNGRLRLNDKLEVLFNSCGIVTKEKTNADMRAHSVCGFHSLRHTFVTALRERGATLNTAKELAGHNTPTMTEHYTHESARAVLALPDMTVDGEKNAASIEAVKEEARQMFEYLWEHWNAEQRANAKAEIEKICHGLK